MRKIILTIVALVILAFGSVQAQTDSVYFEECGVITLNCYDGMVFEPDVNSTHDVLFLLKDFGDYSFFDTVKVTGYFDANLPIGQCNTRTVLSNTIEACEEYSCLVGCPGNVDGDPLDIMDIGDLTKFIDYLFISYVPPDCLAEADFDYNGIVDIGDLTRMITCSYITWGNCCGWWAK